MPDFPITYPSLNPVTFLNLDADLWSAYANNAQVFSTASVWTTANTAIYSPFAVQSPTLIYKMAVQVTTQSGNCDIGIYDEKGTRLVSTGSTAVAAAGLQVFNITDTWLVPGTYFAAFNCDSGTAAFYRTSVPLISGRFSGFQEQAVGAVTLPNPATFASWSAARAVPSIALSGNATL